LLHLDFISVSQAWVCVDLLLEHTQLIAQPDDLVEKDIERNFFGLQSWVSRV